ncbi:hypothetical protein BDR26DRAFT_775500, partial [Obelidium mucronatum]
RAFAPQHLKLISSNLEDKWFLTGEVEKILDHKEEEGQKVYLVKWKDLPQSAASWVVYSDFQNTAIIEVYHAK